MTTDKHTMTREPVNILLVDDQPAKLLSYEAILSDLGENLLKANSGREALEHLLKTDVSVVLMDVCMPEMDGFELASIIRQHPRHQKTAIILVSAINQTDLDRLKGYDCGAMDYVAIPVIPEILRAKVSVFAELNRKTRELHQLNAQLQRQAHLLDQTYDAILAWELNNGIVYWNKAAEHLYGYAPAEAVGQVSHDLLATEFPVSFSELIDSLQRDNEWAGELLHRHRDGRCLIVESRMRLVRTDRESIVLEVNRDITRRRELERDVLEIASHEQNRIGQELHDGVNQELFALNLIATALSRRLDSSSAEENLAEKIGAGLVRVQQRVRAAARDLVPVELDPEGLRAALEDLKKRTTEYAGIHCTLDCPEPFEIEDSLLATNLLYIAREAVHNAVRHSRAKNIQLTLSHETDRVVLVIRDDGTGVQVSLTEAKGLGIRLMQHRAGVMGGRISLGTAEGGGTMVACTLPMEQNGNGHRAKTKVGTHRARALELSH